VLTSGGDRRETPDFEEGGGGVGGRRRSSCTAALRHSAGDGERRGRCGPTSWTSRWRRLAPVATSSDETVQRSLAPMAAAAFCRGASQGREERGTARAHGRGG
jgi:hypothetical protein